MNCLQFSINTLGTRDYIFKQLIALKYPVTGGESCAERSETLSYEELNGLRYAPGYVPPITSNQGSPCKNYMQTLHIYVEQVGISQNKLTQMLHKNFRDT